MRGQHFILLLLAAILLPLCYSAWISEQRLEDYRHRGVRLVGHVVDKQETNRRGQVRLVICEYQNPTTGRIEKGEFSWGTEAWESVRNGDPIELVSLPEGHPIPVGDLDAHPWRGAWVACAAAVALYLAMGWIHRRFDPAATS